MQRPGHYITPSGRHLTVDKNIGSGSFGVAKAVRNAKGEMFCVKEILMCNNDITAKMQVLQEVRVMEKICEHPNIVKFMESWIQRDRLFILMELCHNGPLDKLIKRYAVTKKRFPTHKVVHYIQELANALHYMHDNLNVMHRDVKPANIFIDELGTLKLGDFGLAKVLEKGALTATMCGSPLYMSPEQFAGEPYCYKTDVWALGDVSYELVTGHSPWYTPDQQGVLTHPALVMKITNQQVVFPVTARTHYSETLLHTILWMLQKKPHRRPSAREILEQFQFRSPPPQTLDVSVRAPPVPESKADAAQKIQSSFRKSQRRREAEPAKRGLPPLPHGAPAFKSPPPPPMAADGVPRTSRATPNAPRIASKHLDLKTSVQASMAIQKAFRTSKRRAPPPIPVAPPRYAARPAPQRAAQPGPNIYRRAALYHPNPRQQGRVRPAWI